MLWDTHMHTHFSGDSDASPEAMITAGITKGLAGICITDHLDLDYPGKPDLFRLDMEPYRAKIRQLTADYQAVFPICLGIEIGLQPHLAPVHKTLLDTWDFDFVIASSHVIHGLDPYFGDFFDHKTEDEAYLEYFTAILENIRVFDDFDVYGHIDYVVRYGPNQDKYYSYKKFADIIDAILKELIARGKGIEVNTGGLKYGLGHPNPTEEIIARYRALGGEIITIGSDAHSPEHVGYAFAGIPDLLREAGFRYYTVFQDRQPRFLPLR